VRESTTRSECHAERRTGGGKGEASRASVCGKIVVPFVGEKQMNVSPTVAAEAYLTAFEAREMRGPDQRAAGCDMRYRII
jgi:hypothetical protein